MSHFSEIKMQIKSVEAAVEALLAMGFTKDQIEVHTTPRQLYDHQCRPTSYAFKDTKDQRFAQGDVAHVIVSRGAMGRAQNDFGIYVDPKGGDSRIFLCDFARSCNVDCVNNPVAKELGGYSKWLSKFKQEYSYTVTKNHYAKMGKKVQRVQDGQKVKVYVSA